MFGFKEVVLSSIGTIHSECWDISTKGGCRCEILPKMLRKNNMLKVYDKVVTISHNWCNAVFHSIVECLVKLGYYINELLLDSSIKIHTIKSAATKYLYLLGFNKSRIIYGNIYTKRLLVLEKGSCGSSPPIIHLISIRNHLREKIVSKRIYDIIFIKRYGIRGIINDEEIYDLLKMYYVGMKIVVFYPNTSFYNTVNYFKYAKIIIAPHGAGLSNIIISSNCVVIEFLSNNLCYSSLAKNLGLDYYGLYETLINKKFFVNKTNFFNLLTKI